MRNVEMAAKFREAAAYLAEHGWMRNDLGEHGGPRCAVGALSSAINGWTNTGDLSNTGDLLLMVKHAKSKVFDGDPERGFLSAWNNEKASADDVIALFLACADDLDPDHVLSCEREVVSV